ncbi:MULTISPECIES: AraC family transcriptional regulator [unclassified Pseudoxanthomonas]|uniref:helix-turn-helix transcriptional regulator n=1 Tax=unclassified Pseudoxanthomonas TaxID=2645906 RepID=UPI00161F3B62|nr:MULTISPECIES: AraC family transcriptional regulator [unclassified Pseudoxanthomonas]MBB3277529.1 AraC-like DNA-binding protein [Pseudoxanthomonas sp. OG2]MBV7474201.1 AraC family transcriptional regulator [Pseudoxanthomonas sp. PXM05]
MRDDTVSAGKQDWETGVLPLREDDGEREFPGHACGVVLMDAEGADILLPRAGIGNSTLYLIHAARPGAFVELPAGWWSVLVPLAGTVSAAGERLRWDIDAGRCLLWDRPLRMMGGRSDGRWLCLCGPMEAWIRGGCESRVMADLLADEMACPPDLVTRLVALRAMLAAPEHTRDVAQGPGMGHRGKAAIVRSVFGVAESMHAQQQGLRALIDRCPGRSHRRKRWSMQRLLRIRHAIVSGHHDGRMSLDRLSRQVSYSRGHLARVYHSVFSETPSECAIRMRLQRALWLVEQTGLAFCDIAEYTGFDSQSSFSRAFKGRHGVTPTQARARSRDAGCGAEQTRRGGVRAAEQAPLHV